jgi:hypothetical protein
MTHISNLTILPQKRPLKDNVGIQFNPSKRRKLQPDYGSRLIVVPNPSLIIRNTNTVPYSLVGLPEPLLDNLTDHNTFTNKGHKHIKIIKNFGFKPNRICLRDRFKSLDPDRSFESQVPAEGSSVIKWKEELVQLHACEDVAIVPEWVPRTLKGCLRPVKRELMPSTKDDIIVATYRR